MQAGKDENHSANERLLCVLEATDFLLPKRSELIYFYTKKMPVDYTGIIIKQTSH
tara:strand:+ start:878 stop:1042 length:165 start_codon:yes stop_codon:yes gene_type:complete